MTGSIVAICAKKISPLLPPDEKLISKITMTEKNRRIGKISDNRSQTGPKEQCLFSPQLNVSTQNALSGCTTSENIQFFFRLW